MRGIVFDGALSVRDDVELIDAVHMMPAQAPGPLLALMQDFLGKAAAPAARRAS